MINSILAAAIVAIPNPRPVAPPGSEGFLDVMNMVAWICFWLCVVTVMGGGGYLGVGAATGREMTGGKIVAFAVIGAILVGSAAGIIGMFT